MKIGVNFLKTIIYADNRLAFVEFEDNLHINVKKTKSFEGKQKNNYTR